jgi:hypothetical protein
MVKRPADERVLRSAAETLRSLGFWAPESRVASMKRRLPLLTGLSLCSLLAAALLGVPRAGAMLPHDAPPDIALTAATPPAPSAPPSPAIVTAAADRGTVAVPLIGAVVTQLSRSSRAEWVPQSVFATEQVVSFYGHPLSGALGVLGQGDEQQMLDRLRRQVAAYQAVNPDKTVVGALHLIYEVAQDSPGADGLYLYRTDDATVQHYIQLAQENGLLLFLDLQIGRSTLQDELSYVLPYLASPIVHLAIDPEFAMPPGERPGEFIGWLDCLDINAAIARVEQLARQDDLPNKIVIVHQFRDDMLLNKDQLDFGQPRVDVVLDMDGFGDQATKLESYNREVTQFGPKYAGIKLFYQADTDLFSEQQIEELDPRPDVIIYQ